MPRLRKRCFCRTRTATVASIASRESRLLFAFRCSPTKPTTSSRALRSTLHTWILGADVGYMLGSLTRSIGTLAALMTVRRRASAHDGRTDCEAKPVAVLLKVAMMAASQDIATATPSANPKEDPNACR